jgi:hypothetical protein
MPLTPELQFQKAMFLLDRGEVEQGESILREVMAAADASNDEILSVQSRCCLGELLYELGRINEAKALLEFVANHPVSPGLDDVLDVEQRTARELLARMNGAEGELLAKAAVWLQSVLRRLPKAMRAVYVEYGDAYTAGMDHQVCFNAFGFESLAGGCFNPDNAEHVGELGEFTWEPSDECCFRAADYPNTEWLAALQAAARSPEVLELAADRDITLIVGEHDGEVCVIRSSVGGQENARD